ncbi:hypothetical protein HZ994_08605 [Akkermansiaceae bacterium]|nr:hypothetical protein HZ994_08605 [Akkermansiaceae bacterium]
MKRLLIPLLAVLLAYAGQAAPFPMPKDVCPPFHRDRLPLDTDSMVSLSRDLTALAQAGDPDSPRLRRASAQTLALALTLDPANSSARSCLTDIAKGHSRNAPDDGKLTRAKSRIWESFDWLASAEAGKDGNSFADLLGDAASALDPGHPTAVSLRDAGERGKWDGWVAPLASFEERKPVIREPAEEEKEPENETTPTLASKLRPYAASIGAVLYDYDEGARKFILRPTTVSMEASEREHEDWDNGPRLRLDVTCREGFEDTTRDNVSRPIQMALEGIHGSRLPAGRVRIHTGTARNYSNTRNQDDMTGPGLILANAAITGIAPEATIIARLDGPDNLALPSYFWSKLEALVDGPGGRLIVPKGAEEYLMAVLALEKPEFFLKYEVLAASSPQDAIALCAKVPDENQAAIHARFKEIRDKSESGALGSYLANIHIRKRLMDISEAAPYHLSAKLLALQGSGARPRMLDKKILAAEILQAIDPFQEFVDMNYDDISSKSAGEMDSAQDNARTHLDRLERYTEIRDRELIGRAKSLASELRSLSRVIRGRGEVWEKIDQITEAHRTFKEANGKLRKELSEMTGDALPEDEEAMGREGERRRERFRNR